MFGKWAYSVHQAAAVCRLRKPTAPLVTGNVFSHLPLEKTTTVRHVALATQIRGWQTSSEKSQRVEIFWVIWSTRFLSQLCHHSAKAAVDNMETAEHGCGPVRPYLQKDRAGGGKARCASLTIPVLGQH